LGSRDQKDHGLSLAQAKSLQESILTNGWAWWHMPVIPAIWEALIKRVEIQANPGHKARPYLKKSQNKKGW
jgi:hypothetical protein